MFDVTIGGDDDDVAEVGGSEVGVSGTGTDVEKVDDSVDKLTEGVSVVAGGITIVAESPEEQRQGVVSAVGVKEGTISEIVCVKISFDVDGCAGSGVAVVLHFLNLSQPDLKVSIHLESFETR